MMKGKGGISVDNAVLETLTLWGEIHHFEVSVTALGTSNDYPRGRWIKRADTWILSTTEVAYVFTGLRDDERLRRAISHTALGQMTTHETEFQDASSRIEKVWDFLQGLDNPTLFRLALGEPGASEWLDVGWSDPLDQLSRVPETGWFFYIRPDTFTLDSLSQDPLESLDMVAREFLHANWSVWLAKEVRAFLFFVSEAEMRELLSERFDGEVIPSRPVVGIADVASALANAVAEDALISCRITVSSVDPGRTHSGLAKLTYAERMCTELKSTSFPGTQSQHGVFGLHPFAEWLFALPEEWKTLLIQSVVRQWNPTTVMRLTDVQETLYGLVQANLNASEAARILFVHRNTLNHRIDKIRTQTGYDVRQFTDSLVLYVISQLGILPSE